MAQVARICLSGPESTGKSVLAERLARHLDTFHVPEFARDYALAAGRALTFDDVEPIARGQLAIEASLLPRATRALILDTDLISTVVYSHHYYGRCPGWIEEEAARRRADIYLLMDIDVPWIPDPARDAAHDRMELFSKFQVALQRFDVRFEIVRGDWEARFRRAAEIVAPYAAR